MPSKGRDNQRTYRGRIAPTPSGLLHTGHARTFWMAWHRCRTASGTLVFRNEDLDPLRCKANLTKAAQEDLRWLGLDWEEGPDVGGPDAPYHQGQRTHLYLDAWKQLVASGHIYPCQRSRKELRQYAQDKGLDTRDPVFPISWRPQGTVVSSDHPGNDHVWRFRVPEGRKLAFVDGNPQVGEKTYTCGKDFGDFVIWRRDNVPAYELAVVVDDAAMGITEVVRGEDLLVSTARQMLLYEALGFSPPAFFHCPLLLDEEGQKLSKSLGSRSIAENREAGADPKEWRSTFRADYERMVNPASVP